MITKKQLLDRMAIYRVDGGGIGSWLTDKTSGLVLDRLCTIDSEPLTAVQLNQLLVLAHEAPVSDGFFCYYWLDTPDSHPYDVRRLPGVQDLPTFLDTKNDVSAIESLNHLAWGLHRLYIDGLLYFGNIRTAFRSLRAMTHPELEDFFATKRFDTDSIKRRGPPLPLRIIPQDKRHLISEMACKSYGENALDESASSLRNALIKAYASYREGSSVPIPIRSLISDYLPAECKTSAAALAFSASDILDNTVSSLDDVAQRYNYAATRFEEARKDALENTKLYLSMLTDLDVYVATSMRDPGDFTKMAHTCDMVFSDARLKPLNLRYFDPTLSAANGHEDKGLIECLMVKCAKVLVYCGGDKESFGKDAEAAMALSLGKPVIFFCEARSTFYREVHPLTRLIDFETGVAVGAMVTDNIDHVTELLARVFENRMAYFLERSPQGSLRLKEEVTGSVVRLQTSDPLLTETFWNHYHLERNRRPARIPFLAHVPVTTVPAQAATRGRDSNLQGNLSLGDTNTAMPMAARHARPDGPHNSAIPQSSVQKPLETANTRPNHEFPLSETEVYDGISKVKSDKTAGRKRRTAFCDWLEREKVGIVEGIKLLRFAEQTLDATGAQPTFVYSHADLTRWYREMSSGEIIGTRK